MHDNTSMVQTQVHFTPDWAKDAIFYQIFPERFANGDTSNDPPGVERWENLPKGNNYFGGDIQGIIDHLEYVRDLGITAIYLNPVFASPSNHKYYTSDYLKIDPAFGTNELFQKLVHECHAKKIRIVIDGVFNHTGTEHWAFRDIVKNGEKSKYVGWYNIYSFPISLPPRKPNYECWWNFGRLPKLMVEHPEVKAHLFDVTRYWTNMGIDGWRLDVPNEIPHSFWIEWRSLVKSLNPQCYIVGEIWDDATPWLKGDQFDAVMNYQFRNACLEFFCRGTILPSQFTERLAHTRSAYPDEVNFVLQNLVGSHDTERYLTLCKNEMWKVELTVLFQMTYLGAPMVYYGDEIGMEGGKDPDCRRTMIWDESKWNKSLRQFYSKMMSVRNSSPALRRGNYRTLLTDDERELFVFERRMDSERMYIAINKNKKSCKVEFPVDADVRSCADVLTNENVKVRAGHGRCAIKARSGRILAAKI
jgi:cyclomaltodextrinase / maltogenic alpha-amylase / neopullulanase